MYRHSELVPSSELTFFPPTPMEPVYYNSDQCSAERPTACTRNKPFLLVCFFVVSCLCIVAFVGFIDVKTPSVHVSAPESVLSPSLGASVLDSILPASRQNVERIEPRVVHSQSAPRAITVVSFTSETATASLSRILSHEFGTAHVHFGHISNALPSALYLRGELVSTDVMQSYTETEHMVDHLRAEIGGAIDNELRPSSCTNQALPDGRASTFGLFVHISCVADQVVTVKTPIVCNMSQEVACLAPGRDRLPISVRYDRHVGPWVFEYLVL